MPLTFFPITDVRLDNDFLNKKSLRSFAIFSDYYREYYGDNYHDLSFGIFNDNSLIGYVLCGVLNNALTTPDGGCNIVLIPDIATKEEKKIYTEVLDNLVNFAKHYTCSSLIIKDHVQDSLSILGELLFNQRFESKLTFEMSIPFLDDSNSITLRKSYKSLINWGGRELKTEFVNQNNPDKEKFNIFQKFHHKISGRITRSQETWETQYHMIQEGLGELILATHKGQLAAGAMFSDYGNTSIYFTGVYERGLFEFGISHYILHEGIDRSYKRRQTSKFSLGYFDTDIKDPKFYNIQFFKKGFCKELTPVIFWSKKVQNG